LNRLTGEFFAALPGLSAGSGWPRAASVAPTAPVSRGIEQAPRVDVPAGATGISRVPGADVDGAPGSLAGGVDAAPVLAGFVPAAAGPASSDAAAASTVPPDPAEAADTVSSAARTSTAPTPEEPLIPGLTGLQLAGPGQLTPGLVGLSQPLPSAGVPGMPASDQILTGGGVPAGVPDVTTVTSAVVAGPGPGPLSPGSLAEPFGVPSGGFVTPELPAVPLLPGATGAAGLPSQVPGAPLPSAGLPGLPASDQLVTGGDLPGGGQLPDDVELPNTTQPSAAPIVPFDIPDVGLSTPEVPAVPQVPGLPDVPGAPGLPSGLLSDPLAVGTPSIPQPPLTGLGSAVPDPVAPVPTPATPYYFLAESSPYRPADATGGDAARDAGLDSLAAAAFSPVPVQPPLETYLFLDRPEVPATADPANPAAVPVGGYPAFDVTQVRRDFPILSERVNGKPLIWLDNAATTQKPQAVIDRLAHFYEHENSNIHRAAHELAARSTDAYEGARKTVARFIGAGSHNDIVFVRGATEAINLVAKSWGKANIHRGDEIVISHLEHHANIVPWQQLISETGAVLRVIPVDDSGQILLDEYAKLLSTKTKLVAVTQVSNALGTVTPAEQIVELGHRAGARVLIDGAQSVPHLRVNMQALGADFFVFSGHKIFAPTGIGVLYGRPEVLESMPPWEGGGNMIVDVTFEKTTFQEPPARFEAGTGNIADAVGLGAALDYVNRVGLENIAAYEHSLLEYATPRLRQVSGLRLIGTARDKASVMSFVLDGYRTEEVGAALNQEGIAVRSGHHCAQPILRRFGVESTVRPSLAFYNTCQEIDVLVAALHRLAADRGRR